MKVVVLGGTGLIGSKVVARLTDEGHEAVAASPGTGVDTMTGAGLDRALEGADVAVDVTNSPSFEDSAVREFFEKSTRNILEAEKGANVGHHVVLSVVGTDRLPDSGYFRAKQAQENLIRDSGIPYTIVHATQFFEFLRRITDDATRGETVRSPPQRTSSARAPRSSPGRPRRVSPCRSRPWPRTTRSCSSPARPRSTPSPVRTSTPSALVDRRTRTWPPRAR